MENQSDNLQSNTSQQNSQDVPVNRNTGNPTIEEHNHDGRNSQRIKTTNLDGYDKLVNTIDAQTVNGIKTFGSIPVLPASNPTTDDQAVRKKYVDDTFALTGHTHSGIYTKVVASDTTILQYSDDIDPGKTYSFRCYVGGVLRLKIYAKSTGGQNAFSVKVLWNNNVEHLVVEQTGIGESYTYFTFD